MPKKNHPLAAMIQFARLQPVDMVEAALALMKQELKTRSASLRPTPTLPGVRKAKSSPSHTPPVNPASYRAHADEQDVA